MRKAVAVWSVVLCALLGNGCFGPFDPTNPAPARNHDPDDSTGTGDPTGTPGLLAWWTCNGTDESRLIDSLGNFDGTVFNCTRDSGVDGTALRFDGTSSYVSVNPVSGDKSFNFQKGDFTISLWVKPMILSQANDTLSFLSRGVLNSSGFVMTILQNRFSVIFADQIKRVVTDEYPADAGEWWHVVLTRKEEAVTLYLNGNVVIDGMYSSISIDSRDYLLIGRDTSHDSDNFYTGLIDEIKIFNKAWEASDVGNEYRRFGN